MSDIINPNDKSIPGLTRGMTPGQQAVIDEIRKDGDNSPTFTADEKLQLVARGLMAPEEVGLKSAEEAQLQVLPEAEKVAKLGMELGLQMGVVPMEIRAEWARRDLKIIPTDISQWKADWIEKNKNTHRIQGRMMCGTLTASFERTYSDPFLGLALMLKFAGGMLEKFYLGENAPEGTDSAAPEQQPEAANETPQV